MKRLDVFGKTFNRLTVIEEAEKIITPSGRSPRRVKCSCVCGIIKDYALSKVVYGQTKSCGCQKIESATRHGKSRSKAYLIWRGIIGRSRGYYCKKRYFDRGIGVCKRWLKFENFYADMGEPKSGMSIDRINNNKGYSPKNCRWATKLEQSRNRECTVFFKHKGKNKCVADWCDFYGISRRTFHTRVYNNWSIERALTTPVKTPKRYNFLGRNLTVSEWAEVYGIDRWALNQRFQLGWSTERALTTPVKSHK